MKHPIRIKLTGNSLLDLLTNYYTRDSQPTAFGSYAAVKAHPFKSIPNLQNFLDYEEVPLQLRMELIDPQCSEDLDDSPTLSRTLSK